MVLAEIENAVPRQLRRRTLWHPLPLGLLIAVLVSLAIDLPVEAFARVNKSPGWLTQLLEISEAFGHGVGVTLIVIAVFVLDPGNRPRFPQLLAGSLGAGVVANVVKLPLIRFRPRSIEVLPETVWSTFGGFWSMSAGNQSQSFPSAHTATAVGLAVMLSDFYPHGRAYFTVLAILVGMQRIHCSAHFPSDVFAGAIVGWCTATGYLILASRQNARSKES